MYSEWIRWPPYFAVVILGPAVAATVVAVVFLVQRRYEGFLLLAAALVLAGLFYEFRGLCFEVTDKEVRFGFPIVNRRFPLSRVTSCELYRFRMKNFLGIGVHGGRDGTIGFNTRNGPGIKLVIDGERRPYAVAIDDPAEACRVMREKV